MPVLISDYCPICRKNNRDFIDDFGICEDCYKGMTLLNWDYLTLMRAYEWLRTRVINTTLGGK